MGNGSRPSVCYVVAGHNLLTSAGPTRNVLSLARALSEWADVTVAFRRVLESVEGEPFKMLEIEPGGSAELQVIDDAAVRGVGYFEFAGYLRALDRFAERHLPAFDVVLEKSWLLSGYVTAWCLERGIPAIPVLNLVPLVRHAWRRPSKAARNWVARGISGRYLRQAPRIIAESDDLKTSISQVWRVPPGRIDVVGLGVDHERFRPLDQAEARRQVGVDQSRKVLLYVGALDKAHDLVPVVQALARAGDPSLELHLVGDGEYRSEIERQAAGMRAVVFHGRVSHDAVPTYIACADLCIAPYDPHFFPRGQVGYATLKVREYLAAGRPVATSPTGVLPGLIRPLVTGFLVHNDVLRWVQFLQRELPGRQTLRIMGTAAAATPLDSWDDTARAYWSVCERVMARVGEPAAV
jgi:glycosyltransferase involved in cell wall biosynthesis